MRAVRGVLTQEGIQTGDGRIIVEGALDWAPLPLPIGWIMDGDQHADMIMAAPQVGIIETITRNGQDIEFTGQLDDENPMCMELIRRMAAGTASNGNRQLVSIDPDNYEVQIVQTAEPGENEVILVASGTGTPPASVRAAAGEGDPVGGIILYETSSDEIIERYTRLRIRGVTACSVSAFDGAWMELDDAPAETTTPPPEMPPAPPAVAASAGTRPARSAFYEPEPEAGDERLVEQFASNGDYLGLACPLTITEDRRVFGHLAASWDQCHTGYGQVCVAPPASPTGYTHFHIGEVLCDDGSRVPTGPLVVGCDHAAAAMLAQEARDFYAHAGLGWADVRIVDGVLAPWVCGVLRPGLSDDVVHVLRATTLSGDWRRIGGALELIVGLSVNGPGFPVAREALAASGLQQIPEVRTRTHVVDGVQTALVAASLVSRCKDCAQRRRNETDLDAIRAGFGRMTETLERIDRRTRHLVEPARDATLARIRRA